MENQTILNKLDRRDIRQVWEFNTNYRTNKQKGGHLPKQEAVKRRNVKYSNPHAPGWFLTLFSLFGVVWPKNGRTASVGSGVRGPGAHCKVEEDLPQTEQKLVKTKKVKTKRMKGTTEEWITDRDRDPKLNSPSTAGPSTSKGSLEIGTQHVQCGGNIQSQTPGTSQTSQTPGTSQTINPDSSNSVIVSFPKELTEEQCKVLRVGNTDPVMETLLGGMISESVQFVSEAVLEVIMPAVHSFLKIHGPVPPVSPKRSSHVKVFQTGKKKSHCMDFMVSIPGTPIPNEWPVESDLPVIRSSVPSNVSSQIITAIVDTVMVVIQKGENDQMDIATLRSRLRNFSPELNDKVYKVIKSHNRPQDLFVPAGNAVSDSTPLKLRTRLETSQQPWEIELVNSFTRELVRHLLQDHILWLPPLSQVTDFCQTIVSDASMQDRWVLTHSSSATSTSSSEGSRETENLFVNIMVNQVLDKLSVSSNLPTMFDLASVKDTSSTDVTFDSISSDYTPLVNLLIRRLLSKISPDTSMESSDMGEMSRVLTKRVVSDFCDTSGLEETQAYPGILRIETILKSVYKELLQKYGSKQLLQVAMESQDCAFNNALVKSLTRELLKKCTKASSSRPSVSKKDSENALGIDKTSPVRCWVDEEEKRSKFRFRFPFFSKHSKVHCAPRSSRYQIPAVNVEAIVNDENTGKTSSKKSRKQFFSRAFSNVSNALSSVFTSGST